YSVGTRGELWANDKLRFGVSAQRETTGIADNEGLGADILYRHSESTWARFDIARSEGPGFGSSFSLNGGLDMAPQTADPSALPSAGQIGNPAGAYAFSFRADMAEVI